jgi:hypothetical protein
VDEIAERQEITQKESGGRGCDCLIGTGEGQLQAVMWSGQNPPTVNLYYFRNRLPISNQALTFVNRHCDSYTHQPDRVHFHEMVDAD